MNTKSMTRSLLLAALIAPFSLHVSAQSKPNAHTQHAKPSAEAAALDVPQAARPAVEIVDQFGKALTAGDLKTVGSLLDPAVLILESGGAERSREEYLGHHAIADAAFLKGAHQQIKRRIARISGETTWVGTESELHAMKDGKATTTLSTETMVLKRTSQGWRIVHIHWSSRPKQTAKTATKDATQDTHALHGVDDTAALLAGAGAGQSMVAERRGVPGPRHVLEHADALALSDAQRFDVTRIRDGMQRSAIGLGQAIVAAETELDRLFAASPINDAAIAARVAHIGALRAQLRQAHLEAHIATAPLLTAAQRERYMALRANLYSHRE